MEKFRYGFHNDNALSYLIRMNNKALFAYMLARGVSPLTRDSRDQNAVHHAVELDSPEFLHFLLFRSFDIGNRIVIPSQLRKGGAMHWLLSAWACLDQFNSSEGMTPFHLACKTGNQASVDIIIDCFRFRCEEVKSLK